MWPFTRRHATERPLKERVARHVLRDHGLRSALSRLGGIPRALEIREEGEGHVAVPWRLGERRFTLHGWCPQAGSDGARDAQRSREMLTALGVAHPPTLHAEFSDEMAERTGVWCLLVAEEGVPLASEDLHAPAVQGALVNLLHRLHRRTSSVAGRPWRAENAHQPWSVWWQRRTETLLSALAKSDPRRAGGVAWLRERFAERRQPDEVFVPFSLTLGPDGWDSLVLAEEGKILVGRPEAMLFAPFERDLAEVTLAMPSDRADDFVQAYLAAHGPRERQRVHLNLGPQRAFAALERAHEPNGWERLLRIAEEDL